MLKTALAVLLLICCLGAPRANNAGASAAVAQSGPMEGVLPAPPPGSCVLGQTQQTIEVGAQRPCDTTFTEIAVAATPGVKLYVRYGQPVTMEAGNIVADYKAESSEPFKLIVLEPPHPGGTYYVALTNCGPGPANYSLRFGAFVVDYFGPVIKSASSKGKKLFVSGCGFSADESVILLDGVELATEEVALREMPTLLNRKAAKKAARKESVSLEVRDSLGRVSPPFTFVHPDR
ncbi:MAG TPA: hypothetical protein VKA70_16945 [Blastocatellia bacterium]|nr:hypothetical protein [Blastocatellia bacterium]